MIEYISQNDYGLITVSEDGKHLTMDTSLIGLLNRLSLFSLRTVETSLKTSRKILQCSNKIPIYIDPTLLFLQLRPLRSKMPLLVNYFAIAKTLSYHKDSITLIFKSGSTIDYPSLNAFERQCQLSKVLIETVESNNKIKKVFT